jgi:hypothetical protein
MRIARFDQLFRLRAAEAGGRKKNDSRARYGSELSPNAPPAIREEQLFTA